MSVQELLATHDCSVPGCPDEARERGGLCAYHASTSDRPRPVHPGSHAHLMKEPHVNTCKMPDCTNPSAGKGGWCVGLCDEHVSIEGTRRQAVRRARLQAEKAPKPQAVKPPPAVGQPRPTLAAPVAANTPAPAVPERATNGHTPLSLTELAQAVDQARATYDAALSSLRAAVEAA